MGKIQVLNQETINKIAAGEVIERPASVVKELMENAIDAMATAITVEIKEGGIALIRITDNGAGIPKDEVKTAFLRHATSKITSALDLITVSSLGFRGEALSSIGAVSMVELVTKQKEDFLGTRYEISGGKEGNIEEIGVPDGTTFIVRNLFFNVPARKKFLKTPMTEAGYINDIVCRMAMSHPEISIRFINNGKNILHTIGNGNLRDVIYTIYGKDIALNLIELNMETDNMSIKGFIGKPVISRGNRTYENYFINGRYIKSNIINKAIEEGYRNFMMQHKYPFTAIQFLVKQELLDVNVHPAKMELRIRNAEEIYPAIINVIAEALREKELIQEASFEPESKREKEHKQEKREKEQKKPPEFFETNRIMEAEKPKEAVSPEETVGTRETVSPKETAWKTPENIKVTFNTKTNEVEKFERKSAQEEKTSTYAEKQIIAADNIAADNVVAEENSYNSPKPEQMELFDDRLLSKESRIKHQIIGQIFDTYWIVQFGDKMYIIDQHAAHERVLYEKTLRGMKNREYTSQNISPPIILELSMKEAELLNTYMDRFLRIGFEIESFGPDSYAVCAVPDNLFGVAKKELLMEMIDSLSDEIYTGLTPEVIDEKVASMSCKAAVKGNMRLSAAEADALIGELLGLENPYHCPHGRPTIISMTKRELEKKFKRII